MTDFKPSEPMAIRRRDETFDIGGLRFVISENDSGANLAVFGDLGTGWCEMMRFQDYVDDPHYHAPVGGWHAIDRSVLGDPLTWWMEQLRNHLAMWLERAGFEDRIPTIDLDAVRAGLPIVEEAMTTCIPNSYVRDPKVGVRRTDWSVDESALQKRNERTFDFGGLRFDVFFDRDLGVTMEILALTDDGTLPMIRLDDYEENPHYHAPVGTWFGFDRARLGEPLAWFIDQLENNLSALFELSRVTSLYPSIDAAEVTAHARELYDAMAARVPRGCVRVPDVGLQRFVGL